MEDGDSIEMGLGCNNSKGKKERRLDTDNLGSRGSKTLCLSKEKSDVIPEHHSSIREKKMGSRGPRGRFGDVLGSQPIRVNFNSFREVESEEIGLMMMESHGEFPEPIKTQPSN